jgi:hypothetical protein
MESNAVDRIESSDRISADNGMSSNEILARVEGVASGFDIKVKVTVLLRVNVGILGTSGDR